LPKRGWNVRKNGGLKATKSRQRNVIRESLSYPQGEALLVPGSAKKQDIFLKHIAM
jgi:hypothetical protein